MQSSLALELLLVLVTAECARSGKIEFLLFTGALKNTHTPHTSHTTHLFPKGPITPPMQYETPQATHRRHPHLTHRQHQGDNGTGEIRFERVRRYFGNHSSVHSRADFPHRHYCGQNSQLLGRKSRTISSQLAVNRIIVESLMFSFHVQCKEGNSASRGAILSIHMNRTSTVSITPSTRSLGCDTLVLFDAATRLARWFLLRIQ